MPPKKKTKEQRAYWRVASRIARGKRREKAERERLVEENKNGSTELGFVIIHQDGSIDLDYFHERKWQVDKKLVNFRTWLKHYRPGCRIVWAQLSWQTINELTKE